MIRATLLAATALVAIVAGHPAQSQTGGNLVMYCGSTEDWCRTQTAAFERHTAIKVAMLRKSSGEIYATLKAEASNPRADIWWGGSGDPHMQAAEEGLTMEYTSPNMGELHPWAVKQWELSKKRAVGIFAGAMGFSYNTKLIAEKKLAPPKCWADLIDPKLRDEVQTSDPNASGTAYNVLATWVQLMGEDKGFGFMKSLHRNVNQYTKSGAAPAKALSLGETTIAINFMHDVVPYVLQGAPIVIVSPCEGTGYEVGSMSMVKGGRNPQEARIWYDWALTREAQAVGPTTKTSYQVPANKDVPPLPEAPDFSKIKFIDYDFAKYGSSDVRRRLLSRWDNEVKSAAK